METTMVILVGSGEGPANSCSWRWRLEGMWWGVVAQFARASWRLPERRGRRRMGGGSDDIAYVPSRWRQLDEMWMAEVLVGAGRRGRERG